MKKGSQKAEDDATKIDLKENTNGSTKCCFCIGMNTGIYASMIIGMVDAIYLLSNAFFGFLYYSVGKS